MFLMNKSSDHRVEKRVLSNGLTVLVYPSDRIPKVSSQIWYKVGSKNEGTGERGLAHFLEHLIFKGTQKMSEMDLTLIAYKLSGYSNAFTTYDYTGYLFDFPRQHWETSLDIFADCMFNCTFKQEHINSELKAVIQELKLYKDDYTTSLMEDMISMIFADHPYHYPVIGYKQDLWSITRETVMAFYKKHYTPANATLVIFGDVVPEEAFAAVLKRFDTIPAVETAAAIQSYHNEDISVRSITLYRDVEQPVSMVAFVVPGLRDKDNALASLASWIIANGKGSRLYRKLVEEEKLVSHIEVMLEDCFDYSMFFIGYYPYKQSDNERILDIIKVELDRLIRDGFTDQEFHRALRKVEVDYLALRENNQEFAYSIGETFLATGDEHYMTDYITSISVEHRDALQGFIARYLRPLRAHTGYIVPILKTDKKVWLKLQDESDKIDEDFLSKKIRNEPIEKGVLVDTINIQSAPKFKFPRADRIELDNGLIVLYHQANHAKKIDLILDMKAYNAYDPYDLQGLLYFTSRMLIEGTKKYSGRALAEELESHGIFFDIKPGLFVMSMLSSDFEKGLELLTEIVSSALFEESAMEHVHAQIAVTLKNYWDDPSEFIEQLARDVVYAGHPHSYNRFGTLESVFRIKHANLLDCYKQFISPQEARLVIVGDLSGYDLSAILKKSIGTWKGPEVPTILYPILRPPVAAVKNYPMNRDQIALGFAGLSVSRFDPLYDPLLLFDQIFTGGEIGSMTSLLFMLREQSGLFYSMKGSLLDQAGIVPGMFFINTLVSRDRLQEAEHAIIDLIKTGAAHITREELTQAKSAITNGMVDNFSSNLSTAITFLLLERYGVSPDYLDERAERISHISCDDVIDRVRSILDPNHIVTIRVGRV
jgi:zinc protease